MANAAAAAEADGVGGIGHVELVNQLWQLKQRYQKHVGSYIPLNMLIHDVDYRASVLTGAEQSGVPELAALAASIQALIQAHGHRSAVAAEAAAPATAASRRPPWRRPTALAALLVLAVVLAGLAAALAPWRGAQHAVTQELPAAGSAPAPLPSPLPAPALRLHGSNTIGEQLAPALVEALLRQRGYTDIRQITGTTPVEKTVYAFPRNGLPELAVEIHAHGSGTAFKALGTGRADLGMASRPILEAEAAALRPRLGELTERSSEHVLALDGLAVIVHPDNPIASLTTQEVAQLFAGRIQRWDAIGGMPFPVEIYARDHQSGTFDTFKSLVLERHGVALSAAARRFESSSELADRVAQDPGAIGFIGLPYVRRAKALAIRDAVEAQEIVPTSFTVGTEDYPLSRRLYLYMPATGAGPLAAEFVEFALSRAGQEVVERIGFVSQNIRTEQPRLDPSLPREYLELARHSRRLSLNFRFRPGSDQLDNKAQRDLQRLVEYLAEHRELQVALLGFTDAISDRSYSLLLSQRRAETVEKALQARGIFPWATRGFGQDMPLASSNTDLGQQRNRRVEVWVR